MDRLTERIIRADIVLRWSPLLIALLVFLGTIFGLGLIGRRLAIRCAALGGTL